MDLAHARALGDGDSLDGDLGAKALADDFEAGDKAFDESLEDSFADDFEDFDPEESFADDFEADSDLESTLRSRDPDRPSWVSHKSLARVALCLGYADLCRFALVGPPVLEAAEPALKALLAASGPHVQRWLQWTQALELPGCSPWLLASEILGRPFATRPGLPDLARLCGRATPVLAPVVAATLEALLEQRPVLVADLCSFPVRPAALPILDVVRRARRVHAYGPAPQSEVPLLPRARPGCRDRVLDLLQDPRWAGLFAAVLCGSPGCPARPSGLPQTVCTRAQLERLRGQHGPVKTRLLGSSAFLVQELVDLVADDDLVDEPVVQWLAQVLDQLGTIEGDWEPDWLAQLPYELALAHQPGPLSARTRRQALEVAWGSPHAPLGDVKRQVLQWLDADGLLAQLAQRANLGGLAPGEHCYTPEQCRFVAWAGDYCPGAWLAPVLHRLAASCSLRALDVAQLFPKRAAAARLAWPEARRLVGAPTRQSVSRMGPGADPETLLVPDDPRGLLPLHTLCLAACPGDQAVPWAKWLLACWPCAAVAAVGVGRGRVKTRPRQLLKEPYPELEALLLACEQRFTPRLGEVSVRKRAQLKRCLPSLVCTPRLAAPKAPSTKKTPAWSQAAELQDVDARRDLFDLALRLVPHGSGKGPPLEAAIGPDGRHAFGQLFREAQQRKPQEPHLPPVGLDTLTPMADHYHGVERQQTGYTGPMSPGGRLSPSGAQTAR